MIRSLAWHSKPITRPTSWTWWKKLRGGETSAYTERETPIFTCVAGSIADVVELLG